MAGPGRLGRRDVEHDRLDPVVGQPRTACDLDLDRRARRDRIAAAEAGVEQPGGHLGNETPAADRTVGGHVVPGHVGEQMPAALAEEIDMATAAEGHRDQVGDGLTVLDDVERRGERPAPPPCGHTVTKPAPSVSVIVTFNTTATASVGDPGSARHVDIDRVARVQRTRRLRRVACVEEALGRGRARTGRLRAEAARRRSWSRRGTRSRRCGPSSRREHRPSSRRRARRDRSRPGRRGRPGRGRGRCGRRRTRRWSRRSAGGDARCCRSCRWSPAASRPSTGPRPTAMVGQVQVARPMVAVVDHHMVPGAVVATRRRSPGRTRRAPEPPRRRRPRRPGCQGPRPDRSQASSDGSHPRRTVRRWPDQVHHRV